MAHRCRQIGRADEHAVHAIDGADRLQVLHGSHGLGLHQQADFVIGDVEVVRARAPLGHPCHRAAHAAHAERRIACGAHQRRRLLGGIDHRHQQGPGAHVQQLLDQRGLAGHGAHHGLGAVGRQRLQGLEDGAHVVGRVLAVDQQPVEAGRGGDFREVGRGGGHPQADLGLARGQGGLEGVVGGHRESPLLWVQGRGVRAAGPGRGT
ncbi:hypothetical protein D3C86_1598390 [compost metagenome]